MNQTVRPLPQPVRIGHSACPHDCPSTCALEVEVLDDKALRNGVETINDRRALEKLAEIEQKEGRKARYHVEALMIDAKRVLRTQDAEKPDLAAMAQALSEYEAIVKAVEQLPDADGRTKIGSMFISNAKSFLTSAKQLTRRIRELGAPNAVIAHRKDGVFDVDELLALARD